MQSSISLESMTVPGVVMFVGPVYGVNVTPAGTPVESAFGNDSAGCVVVGATDDEVVDGIVEVVDGVGVVDEVVDVGSVVVDVDVSGVLVADPGDVDDVVGSVVVDVVTSTVVVGQFRCRGR